VDGEATVGLLPPERVRLDDPARRRRQVEHHVRRVGPRVEDPVRRLGPDRLEPLPRLLQPLDPVDPEPPLAAPEVAVGRHVPAATSLVGDVGLDRPLGDVVTPGGVVLDLQRPALLDRPLDLRQVGRRLQVDGEAPAVAEHRRQLRERTRQRPLRPRRRGRRAGPALPSGGRSPVTA
jgi:hypothetical protein